MSQKNNTEIEFIIDHTASSYVQKCKQLFVIGTTENTDGGDNNAEILIKYQKMNIPSDQAISSMPDYYNEIKSSGKIKDYIYVSDHYASAAFATSDIIKLDFKSPVPTRAAVSSMLQNMNNSFNTLLSNHNENANSHNFLFKELSSNLTSNLSNHNKDINAHANILSSYVLNKDISQMITYFNKMILNEESRSETIQSELSGTIGTTSGMLLNKIDSHIKASNAHNDIFKDYYSKPYVNDFVIKLEDLINTTFTNHKINGIIDHSYLAVNNNARLSGNVYLNFDDLRYASIKNTKNFRNSNNIFINTQTTNSDRVNDYIRIGEDIGGGLIIETGNDGVQPIKVQQYSDIQSQTKTAYLLDTNGNTSFPNKLIAKQLEISSNSTLNGTLKVVDTATFKQRSMIDIHNLPSSDQTQNIPNTEWVHLTITGLSRLFAVSSIYSTINKQYPVMYPGKTVSELNRKSYVTQDFYCTDTITINPYTGQLSGNNLNFNNASFINLSTNNLTNDKGQINNLNGDVAFFTGKVTCPKFEGTATSAIYDRYGHEVNTKTTLRGTSGNIEFNLIFSQTPNNTNDRKTIYYNSSIKVNPSTSTITAQNFNGVANRAKWADLAEVYQTDIEYPIGTLIQFGGQKQITIATTKINGVISDKPAYLMNSCDKGQPIALVGRVYVRVAGKANKFDYIGLSDIPGVGKSIGKQYTSDSIAIVLQEKISEEEKLVLCSIQFHI